MKLYRSASGTCLTVLVAALAACGGGGGGDAAAPVASTSTSLTVTGTAATGLAIAGATVTGKCKVGTGTATTLANGTFTLTVTDGQLPCVLQVTNPADGTKLHTLVSGAGNTLVANITPLTEMTTARVLGSEPNVFFAAFDAAAATQKVTTANIATAQTAIDLVFTGTIDTTPIGDFITTPLVAATQGSPTSGDAQDKLLDALKLKLTTAQLGTVTTALAGTQTADAIKQTVLTMTAAPTTPPVANTGAAQSVVAGATVTLDASTSSAAAGKSLTYAWTLTSKPAGSAATLTAPTTAKPTFVADVAGTYVASVIVNDGTTSSSAAAVTVTASVANAAPVANAGVAQNVVAGSLVTLDGSASSDANSDPLTYAWTQTSKPADSAAALSSSTSAKPTFTADVAGTYVATLVVNDGKLNSAPVTVTITASPWATSGNLIYERYQHTASVLTDGSILVAGGMNQNSLGLITAERYDPVKGKWAEVGRMNRDRSQHTATVLQSGKILVAGGAQGNTGPMADVEIFEPGTNTWTTSTSLNAARRNHTATLLADGSVLAAGTSVVDTKSTEVFDPITEKWTIKGDMSTVRSSHTATSMPDGRVLVAGGRGSALYGSIPTATAELYDPRTGSWTATGSMGAARTAHSATLLPNGKVMVSGGETTISSSAELYDPVTGLWSPAAPMNTARYAHASLTLSSGLVLVTGGTIPGNPKLGIPNQIADSAEMYDFRTDSWISAGKLSVGRFAHTASLLQSDKVLIAGGYAPTTVTELFTPFLK